MPWAQQRKGGPERRRSDESDLELSREYQEALGAADAARAEQVAKRGLGAGMSVARVYERVIAPAMWRIGELWESGEITVADEHLATALTHQVMASIYASNVGQKARTERVLLAAVEGEQHALGLRMAADVIELAGFQTIFLGADVPIDSLTEAVATRSPDLVALSATMPDSSAELDDAVAVIRAADPTAPILFGGQGAHLEAEDGAAVPGLYVVEDLERLPVTIERALEWGTTHQDRPGRDALPEGAAAAGPERRIPPTGADAPSIPGASAEGEEGSIGQQMTEVAAETADLVRAHARRAHAYKGLAYTDPLTSLPNRRAFEDRAASLVGSKEAQPVTVLMMDLDGFKQVNDSRGHEAGDRLLVKMGRAIVSSLRESDFVARLGGDEFAVLLPRTAGDEARELAGRIGAAIEQAGLRDSVTVSVGVAPLGTDLRRALLDADSALYEAKDAGRNTVRSA